MSIEKDFDNFFNSCQRQGFTSAEMRNVCRPLLRKQRCHQLKTFALILFVCLLSAYYIMQHMDWFDWLFSAIGRLLLIQLLPYWNWTTLYNAKCLIDRSVTDVNGLPATTRATRLGKYETDAANCALCKTFERIPTASNVTFSFLESNYLERGLPVIITDSHVPKALDTLLDAMQQDSAAADFLESDPCDLSTNLMLKRRFNLELALQKIRNDVSQQDKWFMQLRNCQSSAVKASRLFITRPYYYPQHLEPFYSSWLLISHNYIESGGHELYLYGLILVQQLHGQFDMLLRPKQPCNETDCPIVSLRLSAGEGLLFSTDLWTFSYSTEALESQHITSVATIMEIEWHL